jgi:hypothetical protein
MLAHCIQLKDKWQFGRFEIAGLRILRGALLRFITFFEHKFSR